jgi:hypothetical protein
VRQLPPHGRVTLVDRPVKPEERAKREIVNIRTRQARRSIGRNTSFMRPLRALHRADTVVKAAGTTLQATSARGDAMLKRVFQQFLHEYGNGRAVANTRRDMHRERFEHERIEALIRKLTQPEPEHVHGGRPAA